MMRFLKNIPWEKLMLSLAMFLLSGYSWGCAKMMFTGWTLVAFQIGIWGQFGFFVGDLFRRQPKPVVTPADEDYIYTATYGYEKEQQPKEIQTREKSNDDVNSFNVYRTGHRTVPAGGRWVRIYPDRRRGNKKL
jgi:hypothetical protein